MGQYTKKEVENRTKNVHETNKNIAISVSTLTAMIFFSVCNNFQIKTYQTQEQGNKLYIMRRGDI